MKYSNFALPIVLTAGLFGCGSELEPSSTVSPNSKESTEVVSEAAVPANAPTYKVAITGVQPPFTFLDEYGKPQGIDIDLMRAIAEMEGFKVEFYKETYDSIFPSIDSGDRDIIMSGLSYTEERDKKYTLSESYIFVPSAIAYKDSNYTINGISDLNELDLTLGGVEVSKQVQDILTQYPDLKFVPSDTTFLAFQNLIRGEVDVIVQDLQVLEYLANEYPELNINIVPYETEEENPSAQQVVLVKKGNTELMDKINHAIGVLKSTNEIEKVEDKWLH